MAVGSFGQDRWRRGCIGFFAGGEGQNKFCSLISSSAFGGDDPFMRLNQGFADSKAETESSELCASSLLECIENFRQRFWINSETGVGDFDAQLLGRIVAGRNRDLATARGEFHSVVDQVPEDLLESGGVGAEMHFFGVQVKMKYQGFPINFALINIERVLQERVSIDHLEIELHLTLADASEVEQVVDKPRFQLHVATNHLE